MRVKICGITSISEARATVDAGADAIGLNFYAQSPRYINIPTAADIAWACGPFVTLVGLFVDADPAVIEETLAKVPLHMLQFHGNETEAECRRYGRPYLKALRMRPNIDVNEQICLFPSASAILLDAYQPGVPGGTGAVFDWQRVPQQAAKPLVLAGGLHSENVAEAIAATQCYGVDVSGGVESSPGHKDPTKVKNFISNAKLATQK